MHVVIQKLRLALDPKQWLIRLLGLSGFETAQRKPGLIFIQIDGLSHGHFQQSVKRGYLPFLKRLKENEGYRVFHHYSGVPSCTPTIQAELFYGVKQYVPAFKFQDHQSNEIFTFYDSSTAITIEERLERKNHGLLTGGSSYSNIYSGGAKENAHFCVASISWTALFKALNPFSLFILILFNLKALLRVVFYGVLEFFLAVFDSFRGTLLGYGFREEFLFIFSRLLVTIGLRELTTVAVKLDIARGLPVIHVNFFGYDDQAHRRGPSSRFAYWTLPGIDGCVKRIWKAAQDSLVREYEIWIYSDHGQQEVTPYPKENGISIEQAVDRAFREVLPHEDFEIKNNSPAKRNEGCRKAPFDFLLPVKESRAPENKNTVAVTAQGPVGFIYPHRCLKDDEKEKIARSLTGGMKVPLVLTVMEAGKVYAFTSDGRFLFPGEAASVLGKNHPYLEEVAEEMTHLARHPDSGDFLLSGWRQGEKAVSFPQEYGSHAGPGPQETDGFALLPPDIRPPESGHLRPLILRQMAEDYLNGENKMPVRRRAAGSARASLRVMTYNVHSCIGMDGILSPERIARVIARHDPDIIALQELDVGRLRTKEMDQAKRIAELLDMDHHFHPVRMIEEEMFGNAILSRYPLKVIRAAALPRFWAHRYFEPRGTLWAEIHYSGMKLQLLNTHLSFWKPEQKQQAAALCGPEWLDSEFCKGNVILCGDFNAVPESSACRSIRRKLDDVQLKAGSHKPLSTWFGHFPLGRIDHIFVSPAIEVLKVEVPKTRLEKLASDHLPLIAEIKISAR